MNNTQQKTYTKEQNELITEFAATYGLEPSQIIFFGDDPQPFFDRDATAVLIHKLIGPAGIEDEIIPPPVIGSIAVKYRITFEDGSFAGSTGVANLDELLNGERMSPEQIQSLATSRASRGALRNKGIDLVKMHFAAKNGNVAHAQFSGPPRSQRETLLREVHALGYETGYIYDVEVEGQSRKVPDKSGWYRILAIRYNGIEISSQLSDAQLADFAAFLRSQLPSKAAA